MTIRKNESNGKWFISRETEEENYFPCCGLVCKAYEYLHSDGIWRGSTQNESGEYTGYYSSVEEASKMFN